MKLFVSGQRGNYQKKKLKPLAQKTKDFLDRSKNGELFEVLQLTLILGCYSTALDGSVVAALPGYSYKTKMKRYWGKPSTINQLIRETDANSKGNI